VQIYRFRAKRGYF